MFAPGSEDRALTFNAFLIDSYFSEQAFASFESSLVERFGQDVDVAFLTLARIQGRIPRGVPIPVATADRE